MWKSTTAFLWEVYFRSNPKFDVMTKNELYGKEMSNLYAIAKQVNGHFNGSDISFLSEKTAQTLSDYVQFSCANETEILEALRAMKVNPGNTVDSIIAEITENLNEIVNSDLSDSVKELSFQLSLNRLIAYHKANVENLALLKAEIN